MFEGLYYLGLGKYSGRVAGVSKPIDVGAIARVISDGGWKNPGELKETPASRLQDDLRRRRMESGARLDDIIIGPPPRFREYLRSA